MPKEVPKDLLNESTPEVVFKRKNGESFQKIAKVTHFNVREVEALALLHRKIEEDRGPFVRSVFRDIFHGGLDFTENKRHLLVDRVFSHIDKRNVMRIPIADWVAGLSIILRGSIDEKTAFAYKVYDMMRSNKLTKEQIFPMLRGCFIRLSPEEDPDETVKDMIELLVKAIDIDRDGDVSHEEFRQAVLEKNLVFLECMGPVYPSREATNAFLSTFTDAPRAF